MNTEKHDLSIVTEMATHYGMTRAAFESTLKKTIMPSGEATNEQIAAFLIVASKYDLNPFIKEIFAFSTKSGGIQPVVSVDGWLKIINSHPQCNGFTNSEIFDGDGNIGSATCTMYRKDREHPVTITEYFKECVRDTAQWKEKPVRMLRHKAIIQAGRYAFGFSGIVDPDEADRIIDMGDVTIDESATALDATTETAAKLRAKMPPVDVGEDGGPVEDKPQSTEK